MLQEQFDWSKMTIEQMFETRRRAKEEKSRRLARLPVAKKFEIVEKFNAILREALKGDEQRRASEAQSIADED
jgi:hypothetical protein